MKAEIIDYIKRNRVSTTEVADCMGKSGAIEGVLPLNRGHFKVGPVHWVYAYKESNWDVHEQIIDTQEGEVIFIDAIDCGSRAIIGELVVKYLLLYKQCAAVTSNAKFRDANSLIKENYSVWGTGVTPVGCFNTKPVTPPPAELLAAHRDQFDGAIAVCDDSGMVLIPKELHTREFYQRLINIEAQEDIWFDRLDRHKENTFEIVCLKKYLSEGKTNDR